MQTDRSKSEAEAGSGGDPGVSAKEEFKASMAVLKSAAERDSRARRGDTVAAAEAHALYCTAEVRFHIIRNARI